VDRELDVPTTHAGLDIARKLIAAGSSTGLCREERRKQARLVGTYS
jgi:hypothetical protein